MKIEIECGCTHQIITCTNKINLLKAIVSRELKNHELYIRHGYHIDSEWKSDNEIEDVSVYAIPSKCVYIEHWKEICPNGCTE